MFSTSLHSDQVQAMELLCFKFKLHYWLLLFFLLSCISVLLWQQYSKLLPCLQEWPIETLRNRCYRLLGLPVTFQLVFSLPSLVVIRLLPISLILSSADFYIQGILVRLLWDIWHL